MDILLEKVLLIYIKDFLNSQSDEKLIESSLNEFVGIHNEFFNPLEVPL